MYILFIVLSYLLGSIPNALWVGKIFKNIDVRNFGSGNVGSTNAARVLGLKYGALTLILDVLKGVFFPLVAKLYGYNSKILILIGLAAILGHSYSIYLNFKGGKAVATSTGVLLVLVPKVILILVFIFFLVFILTKYVSLASILSAISLPILTFLLYNEIEYIFITLFISLIVVIRHKSNIINLKNGVEPKFSDKV